MSSTTTLREVAELAGVSIGTASQALNNRPNVSTETRARVLDAAMTLGYQLKDRVVNEISLTMVGMLTKNDFGLPISANPFYSYVQAGVESECRKRGLGLMYATIIVDHQNRPVTWPNTISDKRVDGLILIGTFIPDTVEQISQQAGLPIVLVDSYAPNQLYDSVLTDNFQGVSNAIHYLVEQGHTQIGLVGSNLQSPPSIIERRAAYYEALKAEGIHDFFVQDSFLTTEGGYEAANRLLKSNPEVSAILACNDEVALGVLQAAHELGKEVPRDLSLIGFDNIDLAKAITPALTTVHIHKTWMGIIGVRYLIERVQNPDQPKLSTRISTQLVIRNSVAPC